MLELLVLGGRSLPHAMMMMIPEAWSGNPQMDDARRAFYEYSSELADGALGRPGGDGLHRRPSSARRSIATACARRATSSPTTTG
jgi:hypothetical protein